MRAMRRRHRPVLNVGGNSYPPNVAEESSIMERCGVGHAITNGCEAPLVRRRARRAPVSGDTQHVYAGAGCCDGGRLAHVPDAATTSGGRGPVPPEAGLPGGTVLPGLSALSGFLQPSPATQRPSSDIIPTSLRDLFAWRFAGRCTNDASSDIILGHGWASPRLDRQRDRPGQPGRRSADRRGRHPAPGQSGLPVR